jgi:predicted deacetylase
VTVPPFLVCIHDATPAYEREIRLMIRDLAPLAGRRLSFGVVPNWYGEWPLSAHRDCCGFLQEHSEELLLHGYFHKRRRGWGPATLLAERCDEMNGLDPEETRRVLERGQNVFREVFGAPARGFLAPAWQRGHVRLALGDTVLKGLTTTDGDTPLKGLTTTAGDTPLTGLTTAAGDTLLKGLTKRGGAATPNTLGLEYLLGFFSIESPSRQIPLATWTWDCGRWGWLGHFGHGIGWLSHSLDRGIPTLAIHPRDIERGFWPTILRITRELLNAGHEPCTASALLVARNAQIGA